MAGKIIHHTVKSRVLKQSTILDLKRNVNGPIYKHATGKDNHFDGKSKIVHSLRGKHLNDYRCSVQCGYFRIRNYASSRNKNLGYIDLGCVPQPKKSFVGSGRREHVEQEERV